MSFWDIVISNQPRLPESCVRLSSTGRAFFFITCAHTIPQPIDIRSVLQGSGCRSQMTDHEHLTAVAAGAEAAVVAILTVPALARFVAKTRLFKPNAYGTISGFYEDVDGEATDESTRQYSDLPSRVAAWLASSLGLAASIVTAVLAQDAHKGSRSSQLFNTWADVFSWVSSSQASTRFPFTMCD